MKLRTFLIFAALPIFGILAALASIEVGYRVIRKLHPDEVPWVDRPKFFYMPSGVHTLQDYDYSVQKPENTFRIGVVGDSFTFAPYMQFTDSFPKRLEQILSMNGSMRAEVINYGVPAVSTMHEVAFVDQALAEGADLILLQITLNDAEIKQHRPIGIIGSSKFQPYRPDGVLGWALRHWRSLDYLLERIHNSQLNREYVEYFLDLFENKKTWGSFKAAWQAIAVRQKRSGKKFAAVIFPLFGLPLDNRYPFYEIHRKIDRLLTSLKIPHIDISEIYRNIPLERLQTIPGIDRHPNEIAHRMAAERIYLWLESENLIPEGVRLKYRYRLRTRIISEDGIPLDEELYPKAGVPAPP